MISRTEFYICFVLLIALVCGFGITTDSQFAEIKKERIGTRDSILQVQRDSALALALKKELLADSAIAVINRRNLDINTIKKKYENEKKDILVLGADSTLSYFTRTVTH